ncbi:S8 family peptidase [Roseateles violae]|uniref:S8 family peptidase n=1 Tax=Roseateles violae TaxID=3058042 RepID=A0ABT8DR58_9BURK|nr:S8 family peptidase [Pelomonas sp. PFR6]MDN3918764.1 S8 family peptidase [Pelomonas sp. PFR6]
MRILNTVLATVAAGLLLALPGRAAPAEQAEQAAATAAPTARVIVRFKADADSVRARVVQRRMTRAEVLDIAQTRATALGLRQGRQLRAGLSLDERTQVITAAGLDSATLARRLAQDGEVELVAVDQLRKHTQLPNDPMFGGATPAPMSTSGGVSSRVIDQWYLKAPSGEVVSSINAPAAWDITTGKSSVVVAVLDTGVRLDHPDLAGQFVGGYDMIGYTTSAGVATANDGDRADADASDPGDWVSQADLNAGNLGSGCNSEDIGNSSWHGTRVSGLIAASSNNGLGIAGVGWGIKLLPVRVLGKCGGYDSDIIAGMKWAAGIAVSGLPSNPNPAQVLNMSLGGSGSCSSGSTATLYRDAINQVIAKGATVVVAAGNSTGQAVGLPGNCPGVISVAGLRHLGSKVGFSSVGPEVSIAAPGGNCVNLSGACLYPMVSTTNSGSTTPVAADNAYTNGAVSVGTSFSTPLVSGTVALMLSARPSLTAPEVLALLRKTARPFVTSGSTADVQACKAPNGAEQLECYCTTSTCGAGMLDAAAAVAAAQAANTEQITITANPASGAQAGQTITLTVASTLGAGRSVVATAWSLVDGGGAVGGFASATDGSSVTLQPTAGGVITVKVQLSDDLGVIHSATTTVSVAAAPVVNTPSTSSGGGGGAFSPMWLGLLGLACWALRRKPAAR